MSWMETLFIGMIRLGATATLDLKVFLLVLAQFYLAGTASNGTGQHETWRIKRASDSGSTTLAWNGTEWEGSSDGSQQANNDSSGGIDPGILSPQYLEDQPKRP